MRRHSPEIIIMPIYRKMFLWVNIVERLTIILHQDAGVCQMPRFSLPQIRALTADSVAPHRKSRAATAANRAETS